MRLSLLRAFTLMSVLTVMFFAAAGSHAQTTIHVPADQPTIQAGINAANNGDTVLVAPGTYYENIDFKGKAITVTSSGGAAGTIVDGGGKGPVVTFKTSESSASVVSNLTIQNGGGEGAAYLGSGNGGIYIDTSAPTILGNIITHNIAGALKLTTQIPLSRATKSQPPKARWAVVVLAAEQASISVATGTPTTVQAFWVLDFPPSSPET